MSRRAADVKTIGRGAAGSATFAFARDLGGSFFSNLIDVAIEFIGRSELHDLAAIDLIETFFHRSAQPFQAGLIFALPALHQAEAFTHDFAGIPVMAGTDFSLDEAIQTVGQIYISGRHSLA